MSINKKRKLHWRKLDDQAKIYSLSQNINDTSIFRLSVILNDKINQQILEKAVELALETYKAYKVKMEGGFFWYYLDENKKKPVVTEENDFPFQKINTPENNDYLFKVTYFDKKINLELFHTLTDGNSGSKFFREIICRYLELRYPKKLKQVEPSEQKILFDSENSYIKNYKKDINKAYNPPKGYMLKGKEFPQGVVGINHFSIKLAKIKKIAKDNNCTLSVLLVAMLTYSIYKGNYETSRDKKPLNVCIPIDLKNYFSSDTISNFVSYMVVSLNLKKKQNYTFKDFLKKVDDEFKKKLKHDKIVETMSSNGKMLNSIFVRVVPLVLKRIMVILGTLEFKRHFSTTFSNIGIFEIDDKYKEYIEDYYFILAPDWSEKLRCGVVSFKDNLVMTFGTSLQESKIETEFIKLLDKYKIKYTIQGNGMNEVTKKAR